MAPGQTNPPNFIPIIRCLEGEGIALPFSAPISPRRRPLSPDPNHVLFWPLDEPEGSTVFRNIGTAGPTQTLIEDVPGYIAGQPSPWARPACLFPGKNIPVNRLKSSLTNIILPFPLSFELWFSPHSLPGASEANVSQLAGKYEGDADAYPFPPEGAIQLAYGYDFAGTPHALWFGQLITAGGTLNDVLGPPFDGTTDQISNDIVTRQQCHMMITYDGASCELYANGLFVASIPQTDAMYYGIGIGEVENYYVGGKAGGGTYPDNRFHGLIWDVALSDIARNAQYAQDVYAFGMGFQ